MTTNTEPSAGVLDRVQDLCTRKDYLNVGVARVFHEGQAVRIYSADWDLRGVAKVMAISEQFNRLYLDQLPPDTTAGDLLVVEEWRGLQRS